MTIRSTGWNAFGTAGTGSSDDRSVSASEIGASSELKNCRPVSVICHPASPRRISLSEKISRFGARFAKHRIRLDQSGPDDIKTLT